MRLRARAAGPAAGFSMVELMIVVALIVVMAAIALPNIAGFVRQAKVRGATQQVAGEIQTARNKAIVKNVNPGIRGGVVFAILDANTYRFTVLDDDFMVSPPDFTRGTAPLRDLPSGVQFMPAAAGPMFGVGFDQLGRRCTLGSTGTPCPPAQGMGTLCPEGDARCNDYPTGNFLEAVGTQVRVRVQEDATKIVRTVLITQGGRVMTQR